MFKFPEKLYLFNIYSKEIDTYTLQEKNVLLLSRIKEEKRIYRCSTGTAFLLSEDNFEKDIILISSPPARFTLEEAQEDGNKYIINCIKKAHSDLEYYSNHNREFFINE